MGLSSPTSSYSSAYSSPFSSPELSSLPIMGLREKIVDKIRKNRVTLIVGETGCVGLSSSTADGFVCLFAKGRALKFHNSFWMKMWNPFYVHSQEDLHVVAVAKMVAKCRNCELWGEIGYHIGHSKHFSEKSKIVFKTAGFILGFGNLIFLILRYDKNCVGGLQKAF